MKNDKEAILQQQQKKRKKEEAVLLPLEHRIFPRDDILTKDRMFQKDYSNIDDKQIAIGTSTILKYKLQERLTSY